MSELKACPFCKCTEIDAGKDYTRSYYRVDCLGCSAFITAPSLELAIQYWNTRPIEDALRAEIARRDEIIKRLREDAERLAIVETEMTGYEDEYEEVYCLHSGSCGSRKYQKGVEFIHTPDCPITLHHALMKELEER